MTSVPTHPAAEEADRTIPARRLGRRLVQLYAGLIAFGVSMALLLESHLGAMPWDVLHQGISRRTGITIGTATVLVSVVVLLLWIPLRERPGLGTVSNVIVIGVTVDVALWLLPTPDPLGWRSAFVVTGILLNALATAAYIGARFGAGPRDGLMTGITRRTGWGVGPVQTSIQVGVVVLGWLLGGTVGIATVVFALSVGPLVHLVLPRFTVPHTRSSATPISE